MTRPKLDKTPLKDTPETHLRNAQQALYNIRAEVQLLNMTRPDDDTALRESLLTINTQVQSAHARIALAIGMLESSNFPRPLGAAKL